MADHVLFEIVLGLPRRGAGMFFLSLFLILITDETETLSESATALVDFPCRSCCMMLLTFEGDKSLMLLICCLGERSSMLRGEGEDVLQSEREDQ